MNENQSTNILLKTAWLQFFSLTLALIIMGAPFWVFCITSAFCFLPCFTLSLNLSLVEYFLYNILIRPGLYTYAIIATVLGDQDVFAIAFYIIAGIQLPSIIKNMVGYLLTLLIRPNTKAAPSDSEITAAAKDLALDTVAAVKVFNQNDNCSYLNKSKATYADTAIFSFFVVRAICIMSAPNRAKAEEFSNAYVSTSKAYAKKTFSLGSSFDKQFDNRTDFYDRVFATKTNKADMLAAVLEEFEFIIKSDILRNGFAPFSESSPLPILDFDEDMHCQFEVNGYYKYLLSGISKKIQHVQALLN